MEIFQFLYPILLKITYNLVWHKSSNARGLPASQIEGVKNSELTYLFQKPRDAVLCYLHIRIFYHKIFQDKKKN